MGFTFIKEILKGKYQFFQGLQKMFELISEDKLILAKCFISITPETPENQRFSVAFRGYRNGTLG